MEKKLEPRNMKIDVGQLQQGLMAGALLLSTFARLTKSTADDKLAEALQRIAANNSALSLFSDLVELFTGELTEQETEERIQELRGK